MKTFIRISIFIISCTPLFIQGQEVHLEQPLMLTGDNSISVNGGNINVANGSLVWQDTTGGILEMFSSWNEGGTLNLQGDPMLGIVHMDVYGNVQLMDAVGKRHTKLVNGTSYRNATSSLEFSDTNDNSGNFIMATAQDSTESSGIAGNGNSMTIWSPGDLTGGVSAYLLILDEDQMHDGDADPYNNGAIKAYIDVGGVWQTSDQSKKQKIKKYGGALSQVSKLNAYSYELDSYVGKKENKKKRRPYIGVMAQEVEKVIPQAVSQSEYGDYFVNYSMLTPVLIEAIKEQQETIDRLSQRIDALERK